MNGDPHDPARTSWYLTDTYYGDLIAAFTDWQHEGGEIDDPAIRDSCRRFLEREARALDQHRLHDWLAMFAPECVYWVPSTVDAGDPRKEITITFDDRRRLEDRVFRLETDAAWSQQPQSRTSRIVSNIELFRTPDETIRMARANFITTEFRDGTIRTFAGWNGYRLQETGAGWLIRAKQVNLINCDQNLRNPSIVL